MMKNRNRSRVVGLIAVVAMVALVCPAAQAKGGKFTLPAAVPGDVFLCVAERHNPERDFLDQYWGEVWEALQASGVGTDLVDLVNSLLSEGQQDELERLKERASQLVAGVDWDQLDAREFAFGYRMPALQKTEGGYNMGPPDMVFLFRGEAEGAAKVNKAAGEEMLQVERKELPGAKVGRLGMAWAPISLNVAVRSDVIVIAVGDPMLEETLGLLAGQGSKKAISADPRFASVFKKLPPAEDLMFFFDMQRMLGDIRGIAEEIIESEMSPKESAVVNAYQNEDAVALNKEAVMAAQDGDHAKALELILKAHEADPADSVVMYNMSCFYCLTGSKEEALKWLGNAVDGGFNNPKLISADPDLKDLRGDPRYEAALAKATQVVANGQKGQAKAVHGILKRILDVPGIVDHIASIEYTDGYTTHAESMVVLAPDAGSKPFYDVVGKQQPLTTFDRYLPAETVSYSVSNGLDFAALYKFIEDSFHEAGPQGEEMWAYWTKKQQEWEIDVARDLTGWIDGQMVTVQIGQGMASTSVLMLKVTDEAMAREKVASAIEFASTAMKELAASNPMLGMYAPRTSPLTHEKLEGFYNLAFAMQPMVWGVADGYLIFGTSADAVALCLETAAGDHPNIRSNKQVMAEALLPEGKFASVSFTDKRGLGQQLSVVLGMVSMAGMGIPMLIPDPDIRQAVVKVVGIVGKLSPVVAKINFYKSTAAYTTFDGKAWHTREVTHYQSPAERPSATAAQ